MKKFTLGLAVTAYALYMLGRLVLASLDIVGLDGDKTIGLYIGAGVIVLVSGINLLRTSGFRLRVELPPAEDARPVNRPIGQRA